MSDAAKQWKNYNFKYVFGKISYINDLIFYFKKLGSEEQFKQKNNQEEKKKAYFLNPQRMK